VIGLGGIWSYLWDFVGRSMCYRDGAPKSILLMDGDGFELKNLERQCATMDDVNKPKASSCADRMKSMFVEIGVDHRVEFLKEANIDEVIPENTIVLSCVDNHETRLLISRHCAKLNNSVVITGGNDLDSGNVHAFLVIDGVIKTQKIEEIHSEIRDFGDDDRNPGELSCEEREKLPSGGQLARTNFMVAAWMGNMFGCILENIQGKEAIARELRLHSEVFFDLKQSNAAAYSRKVDAAVSF